MPDSEVGTPAEPVQANAMTLTRVTGFAAVITTVGTALTGALGGLENTPTAIVIAILGGITVGLVVAGFVLVTDMRIRSQQTIAINYLRYLRKHGKPQLSPDQNGHNTPTPKATPGPEVLTEEGELVRQLVAAVQAHQR
jgi:hypothetical protein